jgi:hypothetical protein
MLRAEGKASPLQLDDGYVAEPKTGRQSNSEEKPPVDGSDRQSSREDTFWRMSGQIPAGHHQYGLTRSLRQAR